MHRLISLTVLFAVMLSLGPAAVAQDSSTPSASASGATMTVIASGLTNPRGFVWGADGTLYVALASNGGLATNPEPAAPADSTPAPNATPDLAADASSPLAVDESGAVVKIVDGCPISVATNLPSYNFLPLNWADGVIDVAFLDGTLYALVDGGGASVSHPNEPNGVYRVRDDGSTELVADLSAWISTHPVAEPTHDISPDGQPYAMIPRDGKLWITESNHEQLLTVTPDGAITRVIDLSPAALVNVGVPTGLVAAPDGGVYIGLLSEVPFTDGAAKVIEVAADGTVRDVWTGLTAITGIALGPDGTLYASELSTGNTNSGSFYRPHSGKVVRQTGPNSSADVATGLDYPVHLNTGPDGMLYVDGPALGSNGGNGWLARLSPNGEAASSQAAACPSGTMPAA